MPGLDETAVLAADRHGSGERLVLVHGFTQTGRSFHELAHLLEHGYEVVAVDLPDHGRSRSMHAKDLEGAAAMLGASGGRATYVGYSLGGRVALTLALESPDLVERLVLVGATPGIADADERRARIASDERLATRLEEFEATDPIGALDSFLDDWLAQDLFAGLTPEQQNRSARHTNSPSGLARSLRTVGTGSQRPSHGRLHELTMPVLLVAGADDSKFSSIAHEMADAIGASASVAIVDGASHAVPFAKPEAFATLLMDWLGRHRGS